jgi:hypothetical protein
MPAHAFWTANAVVDPSTGNALEYPQLKLGDDSKLWLEAASREIGRLAQGKQPDMPSGNNTMHFLDHRDLPAGRKATYLRIVAAIKMQKVETHRIRFTVGGDRINYKDKVGTPTANTLVPLFCWTFLCMGYIAILLCYIVACIGYCRLSLSCLQLIQHLDGSSNKGSRKLLGCRQEKD